MSVSLPVLDRNKIAHSKNAPKRAAVLIGVHVVIAIHVLLWLALGMTISPVEPSESMQTLEQGLVNAGFIFFILAILSTLVFGRFFCGWACHVVALQDLCSHLLKKVGIRPKPFRSRLLLYVPLILALYMFVWPTFKRTVLAPLLGQAYPAWLAPTQHIHGYEAQLFVDDFWATFPEWYIAVPFLFVCGFVVVYLMGAKGFCTYGCPYGGFFAPLDLAAPGKIRVNDNCEQCGHCTAVCTSNVRVHEEVRDFGMVVDPGCMKCMDCVSVCPNDALSFGFGKPTVSPSVRAQKKAIKQQKKARYDRSLAHEAGLFVLFWAFFFAFRQMFDAIPMLFAVGIALSAIFLTHEAVSLVNKRDVRLHSFQLKRAGRIKPAGAVVTLLAAVMIAMAAWSGIVRFNLWQAQTDARRIDAPLAVTLAGDYKPSTSDASAARSGLERIRTARATGAMLGWAMSPAVVAQEAYLQATLGELEAAAEQVKRAIERGNPTDDLVLQADSVLAAAGRSDEERMHLLRSAVEAHPQLHETRLALASRLVLQGKGEQAGALFADMPSDLKARQQRSWRLAAARFAAAQGDADRAGEHVERVTADSHATAHDLLVAGRVLIQLQAFDRADAVLRRAAREAGPRDPDVVIEIALQTVIAGGEDALGRAKRMVTEFANRAKRPADQVLAADYCAELGLHTEAATFLRRGMEYSDSLGNPWDVLELGRKYVIYAARRGDPAAMRIGVELIERAAAKEPDSPTMQQRTGEILDAVRRGPGQ